jgi:hypothetical protein
MNDLDWLEDLLVRRGRLLEDATRMLQCAVRQGRPFTDRERIAWEWAGRKADELGGQADALAADLGRRRYYPRRSFTERVPMGQPGAASSPM